MRDLSERGVLVGGPWLLLCAVCGRRCDVPGTLQAVIAARIDRLDPEANRALNAAAVIGSRFSRACCRLWGSSLSSGIRGGEFIDQTRLPAARIRVSASPDPGGRIRVPAQIRSRELHRRVAAAIESRDPAGAEENAALIAERRILPPDEHLDDPEDEPTSTRTRARSGHRRQYQEAPVGVVASGPAREVRKELMSTAA